MIAWSDPATYCNLTFHQTPGLGVGLGANVLVRLARRRPKLVEGLVLINCSSTSSGWLEWAHHKVVWCPSRLSGSQLGTHDEALVGRSFTWPRLHDKHLHDVTIAWHMIAWQACAWNTFEWQKYRKHDGTKPWHTLTGRRITFTWRHKYMNVTHVTPKNNYMTYDYMT